MVQPSRLDVWRYEFSFVLMVKRKEIVYFLGDMYWWTILESRTVYMLNAIREFFPFTFR